MSSGWLGNRRFRFDGPHTQPPAAESAGQPATDLRGAYDPIPRLKRQFDNMVSFTQGLVRRSPARRAEFWSKADASSPERWKESSRAQRDYIWEEMIGWKR